MIVGDFYYLRWVKFDTLKHVVVMSDLAFIIDRNNEMQNGS